MFTSIFAVVKWTLFMLSNGALYRGFANNNENSLIAKIAGIVAALCTGMAFVVPEANVKAFFISEQADKIEINKNEAGETEQLFWESVDKHPSETLYREYLKKYPDGQFKNIALLQLQNYKTPKVVTPKVEQSEHVSQPEQIIAALTESKQVETVAEPQIIESQTVAVEPEKVAMVESTQPLQTASFEKEVMARDEAKNTLDESNKKINSVWNSAKKEIRKALLPKQREWLKQRENDCATKASLDNSNNAVVQDAIRFSCMSEMTMIRTNELKTEVNDLKIQLAKQEVEYNKNSFKKIKSSPSYMSNNDSSIDNDPGIEKAADDFFGK